VNIEDMVLQYEKEIIMASYLYYNATDKMTSPISDEEYDARVAFVVGNWGLVSDSFKKRTSKEELKASGCHLEATAKEKKQAIKWAKEKI